MRHSYRRCAGVSGAQVDGLDDSGHIVGSTSDYPCCHVLCPAAEALLSAFSMCMVHSWRNHLTETTIETRCTNIVGTRQLTGTEGSTDDRDRLS